MGPTRKRDLTAAVVGAAAVGYLLVAVLYRWFPPITVWTGLSLLAVAVAEALWARYVRVKISDGEIGDGPGWLHPLVVARSLMVAKASAWVGALVTGWWIGVLAYFLPRRSWLRAAAEDTTGTVVAAGSALALVVAALWLQHCCKSPQDPTEHADGAESSPTPDGAARCVGHGRTGDGRRSSTLLAGRPTRNAGLSTRRIWPNCLPG